MTPNLSEGLHGALAQGHGLFVTVKFLSGLFRASLMPPTPSQFRIRYRFGNLAMTE